MSFEVAEPILNAPFSEPVAHWFLRRGDEPERRTGRRPAFVFQPTSVSAAWDTSDGLLKKMDDYERAYELVLVNRVRDRVREWRVAGYPGATRVTLDLLTHWRREGRHQPLFFAQLEAAESVIFLTEGRGDLKQGIDVPLDDPGSERRAEGYKALKRLACKMATGTGKTTVMGMLASWSIINKVTNRGDARFSDAVLIICPNVTIRDRLRELDPKLGSASLYRTRDLVPEHLMTSLAKGRLLVTNWHVLERKSANAGEVSAKVLRTGVREERTETVKISETAKTGRGVRYLTPDEYRRQVTAELIEVLSEEVDGSGNVISAKIRSERWIESEEALLARVLGRDLGKKDNLLVFNDEAHHAYRFFDDDADGQEALDIGVDDLDEYRREATVWVDGLDLINRRRGINCCVDLSATPYYIARTGHDAGRPFPWVISEFGLTDAIESGLVKIPQLPRADTAGQDRSVYFNLWKWVVEQLDRADRLGRGKAPKPEAVLRWAHPPIAILASDYEDIRRQWESESDDDRRPPVFILVCRDIPLAKLVFDWITGAETPPSVAPANLPFFANEVGRPPVSVRVDTKVVGETDSGAAKDDATRWMRFTLDTVGKRSWPKDPATGREIYPAGFEDLAKKLERPLHPPGRDIRCIVSVGMLTEGWDANTVTHVVGLRPFSSQLLCEQVVGRALRRRHYEVQENGRFPEEVAEVMGVPFEIVPYKTSGGGAPRLAKRHHVRAVPQRLQYEIRFPRVEWYIQEIRAKVTVDWANVPTLTLDPTKVPPEVLMAGLQITNAGTPAHKPVGRVNEISLRKWGSERRLQAAEFALARALTHAYASQADQASLAAALFPQMLVIVKRYITEKVVAIPTYEKVDVQYGTFFTQAHQHLLACIRPDTSAGESPELPRLMHPPEDSTSSVDYWTNKNVVDTTKSHINYVIKDSSWESQAAYLIDKHKGVGAYFKNTGRHFTIPYEIAGERHEFWPDFILRLAHRENEHVILETKGFDEFAEAKQAAAVRWCSAVNADGRWGVWSFKMARSVADVSFILSELPTGG